MRKWSVLAIVILAADQLMKFLAVERLPSDGSRLRSLVAFALHKNYGIAFDFPLPSWIVIPLTLAIIIGAVMALKRYRHEDGIVIALVFIIVGGFSNLIDRVVYGYTVDYIIVFGKSAINLADLMILGGMMRLMVLSWWPTR